MTISDLRCLRIKEIISGDNHVMAVYGVARVGGVLREEARAIDMTKVRDDGTERVVLEP